ncbi:lipopolysaccharide assembly protein LapA domain-containing protein [Ornithinibacillus sp. FSL M8-0202]|uniref:LapA family protein n=1 Tax=unclassified Ornithinibacillus TaxID=2620869 RepID=UPI0030CECE77
MRGQTYVIVAIIFVILVAIFAVMNVSPVQVTYFFWQVESPLILVILFSVLMGGMITAAVGMVRMFKLQKEIKVIRRKNAALSQLVEDKNVAETNGGTQASKANDGTQED